MLDHYALLDHGKHPIWNIILLLSYKRSLLKHATSFVDIWTCQQACVTSHAEEPTLLKELMGRTRYARAMVGAQHDAHLHEARRILRQRALEPEQRDDVADAKVALDQRAHGDAVVCRLLPAVVADGRYHVGRHAHLRALGSDSEPGAASSCHPWCIGLQHLHEKSMHSKTESR